MSTHCSWCVCVSEGSGSPQHVQLMDLWSNWQKRRVVTGEAQTGPLSWQDLDAGRTWFFSGWEHFPGDQFCAISGTFLWVGKMAFFFFFKVSPSPEHDDPNQTVGWKKTVLQKIPLDTPFHYFFFHLMYVLLFPLQYCAAYCKCKFFAASSVNVLYILATILFFVCVNKSLYCSIIYKTRRLKHSNAHE